MIQAHLIEQNRERKRINGHLLIVYPIPNLYGVGGVEMYTSMQFDKLAKWVPRTLDWSTDNKD